MPPCTAEQTKTTRPCGYSVPHLLAVSLFVTSNALTDAWSDYLTTLLDHPVTITVGLLLLGCLVLAYLGSVSWALRDAREREKGWQLPTLALVLSILLPFAGAGLYKLFRPGTTWRQNEIEMAQQTLLNSSLEQSESCRHCQKRLPDKVVYCPHCGERQRHSCTGCQTLCETSWEFCPGCGKSNEQQEQPKFVELKPGETIALRQEEPESIQQAG